MNRDEGDSSGVLNVRLRPLRYLPSSMKKMSILHSFEEVLGQEMEGFLRSPETNSSLFVAVAVSRRCERMAVTEASRHHPREQNKAATSTKPQMFVLQPPSVTILFYIC